MTGLFYTRGGMVLCTQHVEETLAQETVEIDEVSQEILKNRCAMCEAMPVEGRNCQNCGTPLHPRWPAVYCSNKCALDDA